MWVSAIKDRDQLRDNRGCHGTAFAWCSMFCGIFLAYDIISVNNFPPYQITFSCGRRRSHSWGGVENEKWLGIRGSLQSRGPPSLPGRTVFIMAYHSGISYWYIMGIGDILHISVQRHKRYEIPGIRNTWGSLKSQGCPLPVPNGEGFSITGWVGCWKKYRVRVG